MADDKDDHIVDALLRIAGCLERMEAEARVDRQTFSDALATMKRIVDQK